MVRDARSSLIHSRSRSLLSFDGAGRERPAHHVSPPDIEIAWPVIEPRASLHSHSTAAATSSGWMKRPCGLVEARLARASSSLRPVLSTMRLDRLFQHVGLDEARAHRVDGDAGSWRSRPPAPASGRRRRAWPRHRARHRHSPSARPSRRRRRSGPALRSAMPASAGFTVRNAPVKLTSSVRCQSASEVLCAGALPAMPALATTMSNGPARGFGLRVERRHRRLRR